MKFDPRGRVRVGVRIGNRFRVRVRARFRARARVRVRVIRFWSVVVEVERAYRPEFTKRKKKSAILLP